jgi:hypothetical protein
MYSCLYHTCADINLSLCFCRDGFWRTSCSSFWGSVLTRLWVDGNLIGAFLIVDTIEAQLIWWTIIMSFGGRTSLGETWRLSGPYAGTPDGSWPAKTRCVITCRNEFWGNTTMSKPFSDLLRRLGILSKRIWLWPSWNLLPMSLANRRGVVWSRRQRCGSMRWGT